MKKILTYLTILISASSFADQLYTIEGHDALELFDRIERTGVERSEWQDRAGTRHISMNVRSLTCDQSSLDESLKTLCIIDVGFLKSPVVSRGHKAEKIMASILPAQRVALNDGHAFTECWGSQCTSTAKNISCYFDDRSLEDYAICYLYTQE